MPEAQFVGTRITEKPISTNPSTTDYLLGVVNKKLKRIPINIAGDGSEANLIAWNLASLKEIPAPSLSNTSIKILGYYEPNDNGGGEFFWDATSTETNDDAMVILPTGHVGAGRWKRVVTGAVKPEMFGCKGNGVDNDYAKMNAASDYARTTRDKIFELKAEATYLTGTGLQFRDLIVITNGATIKTASDIIAVNVGVFPVYTYYNLTANAAKGTKVLTLSTGNLATLNLQEGDLVKIASEARFTPLSSDETTKQGEIQMVSAIDSGAGTITLYNCLEDSYTTANTAQVAKVPNIKFKTVGTLKIEHGGGAYSLGIALWAVRECDVNIQIRGAKSFGVATYDCYMPNIRAEVWDSNNVGDGNGIFVGNATMYGKFTGFFHKCRHAISTNATPSLHGVSWGNHFINMIAFQGAGDVYDTHASCGSAFFYNCVGHGTGENFRMFDIESRNTYITDCFGYNFKRGLQVYTQDTIDNLVINGLYIDGIDISSFEIAGNYNNVDISRMRLKAPAVTTMAGMEFAGVSSIANFKLNDIETTNIGGLRSYYALTLPDVLKIDNWQVKYSTAQTVYSENQSLVVLSAAITLNRLILNDCGVHNSSLFILLNGAVALKTIIINNPYCNAKNRHLHLTMWGKTETLQINGGEFTDVGVGARGMIECTSGGFGVVSLMGVKSKTPLMKGVAFTNGVPFDVLIESGNEFSFSGIKTVNDAAHQVPGYYLHSGSTNEAMDLSGIGTPEAVVTARVGAIYHRKDGGAGTTIYVKESGTGNTGWVAK